MEGPLNFLTGLSVALILMILFSVRRSHIRAEYSLSWLAAAVTLLILSRSHPLLDRVAAALGFTSPPMALLMLVGCLFLLVLFRLSVIISALRDANIALAQRLAILEYYARPANAENKNKI
jgi:hypothetical protein